MLVSLLALLVWRLSSLLLLIALAGPFPILALNDRHRLIGHMQYFLISDFTWLGGMLLTVAQG